MVIIQCNINDDLFVLAAKYLGELEPDFFKEKLGELIDNALRAYLK